MSTRLTKAQLLERIAQVERELGLAHTTIAQMEREIDAHMYAQRPSRSAPRFVDTVQLPDHPLVQMRGKWFVKVKAFEGGRMVTTYKPFQPH